MEWFEDALGAPFDPERAAPADYDIRAARREADGAGAGGPDEAVVRRAHIRGMLFGGALGDALGAPHEFRNQVPLGRYTGLLEHPLVLVRRFQGGRLVGNVGQVTDDTEMALALAAALVARGGAYEPGAALAQYLAWANSKCPFLGNNTRRLFVGVRTAAGYRRRLAAARAEPEALWSQANGCLMRCAPLAVLPDAEWAAAAALDCALTNFHPVCVDGVRAYLAAAREALTGATPAAATERALAAAAEPGVAAAIEEGRDQRPRLVADERKGWVLHALYCAFYALNSPLRDFQDRIDQVIRLGGDTDTNGAIAGALLGALYGEAALRAESRTGPNLEALLAVEPAAGDLPRPRRYSAQALPELADALADLAEARDAGAASDAL